MSKHWGMPLGPKRTLCVYKIRGKHTLNTFIQYLLYFNHVAILVVDLWISEPSLREKKKTTHKRTHPSQLPTYARRKTPKKTHPAETNNEENRKNQKKNKTKTTVLPRQNSPTGRPCPRVKSSPVKIGLPKTLKWISAGICRSKAWSPVMFTNNSGLPVVKCTVMSVFGSKPSWMDTTEMDGKCTHIESELCIYRLYAINKKKYIYIYKSIYLISNGIPQVYHVQLVLHVHFVKTFCIFLALESQGGNCENNPTWQAVVRFPCSPKTHH